MTHALCCFASPAKAGVQCGEPHLAGDARGYTCPRDWTPAFAGEAGLDGMAA